MKGINKITINALFKQKKKKKDAVDVYAKYSAIHGSNEHESHTIFTMKMYVSTYNVSFGFQPFL